MKNKDIQKQQILAEMSMKDYGFIKYLALAGQLGFVMIISILIWFFLSRYLTKILGIGQIWQAAGIIMGVFTGMLGSYRLLKKIISKSESSVKE
ncbi:MAG: AtpZ/AtpI family protein [Candidatus Stygibacter australis]|nr:AtpZ/AtpI family protein [Candidatus Stygibacter australis]MDP8320995.1 AtpZ/AtpI family protein [Candidatus Stygibacter australis]